MADGKQDESIARAGDQVARAMASTFAENFKRSGALAPRGARNPCYPGSAAAKYWQQGHDAALRKARKARSGA